MKYKKLRYSCRRPDSTQRHDGAALLSTAHALRAEFDRCIEGAAYNLYGLSAKRAVVSSHAVNDDPL